MRLLTYYSYVLHKRVLLGRGEGRQMIAFRLTRRSSSGPVCICIIGEKITGVSIPEAILAYLITGQNVLLLLTYIFSFSRILIIIFLK